MAPALYVHIPFCTSFCPFCDFPKHFHKEEDEVPYLEALEEEIRNKTKGKYETIYIGGGTPSALTPPSLSRLLALLSSILEEGGEFSLECNPETLNEEKVAILAQYGINRVSLGVQSFHPKYIKLLGRHHDKAIVENAVGLLRKQEMTNINLDIMFALPGESVAEVEEDIKTALSFTPTHISAYTLIIEEKTKFGRSGVQEASQDEQADQYQAVLKMLREAGYDRYEVSNFALPGYQCRHNLHYWHDDEYEAVGMGAAGHIGNIRYKNSEDFVVYCKKATKPEIEELTLKDEIECFLLSNLRLEEGFALKTYKKRFRTDFLEEKKDVFQKLEKEGLLSEKDGYIMPTDKGILLLDQILVRLF